MKTTEMFTLWADTNQQILQSLVDLSATSAKESARLYAELQYSALDALREGQAFWLKGQAEWPDASTDPLAWYQRAVAGSIEGAQRTFQMMEGSAQAMTRAAERLQTLTEEKGKQIQETVAGFATKVRDLYTAA